MLKEPVGRPLEARWLEVPSGLTDHVWTVKDMVAVAVVVDDERSMRRRALVRMRACNSGRWLLWPDLVTGTRKIPLAVRLLL